MCVIIHTYIATQKLNIQTYNLGPTYFKYHRWHQTCQEDNEKPLLILESITVVISQAKAVSAKWVFCMYLPSNLMLFFTFLIWAPKSCRSTCALWDCERITNYRYISMFFSYCSSSITWRKPLRWAWYLWR